MIEKRDSRRMLRIKQAVDNLEAMGLIRRNGQFRRGQPVYIATNKTPAEVARIFSEIATARAAQTDDATRALRSTLKKNCAAIAAIGGKRALDDKTEAAFKKEVEAAFKKEDE